MIINKFEIYSKDSKYEVLADDVTWDANGLKFLKGSEIVAMFLTWDCWINCTEEEENEN